MPSKLLTSALGGGRHQPAYLPPRSTSIAPRPTPQSPSPPPQITPLVPIDHLRNTSLAALAACALLAAPLSMPPSAAAVTDAAKVGTCVLQKCQFALAQCLGDAKCAQNLVCLQTCAGTPDETGCQIRCGDKYDDKAVGVFNTCAVSEQKCVPQKVDEGLFPVPPDCSLDQNFNLSAFQGRWYITAGLNPLFDVFPCQEHFFAAPPGTTGTVFAEINWRIPVGENGDFIPRTTMQKFVQQPDNPAVLFNHGNDYLHYEDDWYILSSKTDEYVLVYYRGQNDAWKGYGGATVYTRSKSLPTELIPELREKVAAAGLDWDKFTVTDNSCPTRPEVKGPLEELKEDFVLAERFVENGVEPKLQSFGRGFTILEREVVDIEKEVVKEVEEEEAYLEAELKKEAEAAGKLIARFRMEAEMDVPKWLRAFPLPLKQFIMPMP